MQIKLSQNGDTSNAQIEGELTIYTATELKEQLLQEFGKCKQLQLDLSGVEEVDSAGMQILLLVRKQAIAEEKTLTLSKTSESLECYIDLFNLWDFFQLNVPEKA